MKKTALSLIITFLLFVGILSAQQNTDSKQQTIFESLATPDSSSKATVKLHQDKRIENLVLGRKIMTATGNGSGSVSVSHETKAVSGFRVQVFSSNTQRTAKNEAFKKESQIKEEFPDLAVYVNYSSPFWKVRVGDFRTQAQAQACRAELITAFPGIRSETYIVKEQVNISVSK